jgi:TetR/AcrR family transcriptional regulator, mexCD-oprJ operon repressor
MPAAQPSPPPRKRADAQRSIARILDAAVEALASDPEASMSEVARRAGVVRATIYVHFPTREALIEAVTQRGITEAARAIERADPATGTPTEALERVVDSAWETLGRFHALVTINSRLPPDEFHELHRPVLAQLGPLIQRGQRDGSFRADVPASWHLSMILAVIHAASGELTAGRIPPDRIRAALIDSVLGAVGATRS